MRYLFSLFIILCTANLLLAQIPTGKWQYHLEYRNCQHLEHVGDYYYAGSKEGFFRFKLDGTTIEPLTLQDGFSATSIGDLAYHPTLKTLIIAYTNGKIDLLIDNQTIYNLEDIYRNSSIIGSKKINAIKVNQSANIAYLSTDFGLVVIDLVKREIKETVRSFDALSASTIVYHTELLNDSIFAATSIGVFKIPESHPNILDYNNWFKAPLPSAPVYDTIVNMQLFQEKLYALSKGQTTYSYQNKWDTLPGFTNQYTSRNFVATEDTLFMLNSDVLYYYTNGVLDSIQGNFYTNSAYDVIPLTKGNYLLATTSGGAVVWDGKESTQLYFPASPWNGESFRLRYHDGVVYNYGGSYNSQGHQLFNYFGYSNYANYQWNSYDIDLENMPRINNQIDGVIADDGSHYIASLNRGLLIQKTDNSTIIYDSTNNPFASRGTEAFYYVTSVAKDSKGRIWVSNSTTDNRQSCLLRYTPQTDTWESIALPQLTNGNHIFRLWFDTQDNLWCMLRPSLAQGLAVIRENEGIIESKNITTTLGQGEIVDMQVNTIAEDWDGDIWIGTDKGISVIANGNSIFNLNSFDSYVPIYEGNGLLFDNVIRAIYIDGGNRKWIATTKGVYLFNPDGSQQILHFNEENSPLLSNTVLDITINAKDGEVFFGTLNGICSYRGDASITLEQKKENVKIFPNPIRPDFQGVLTIQGLAMNTYVKITDVSGRLVYQTQANGGTATWDLSSIDGTTPSTGIYFVYAAQEGGEESFVGKFAIIE